MKKITLSKIRLAAMFIVLMALLSASAFAELSASINVDFSTASINIGGSSLILVDVSGYGGLVTSRLEVFRGDSLEYSGGLGFQMSDFTMDDWRVPLQNTQEGLHTFRFTITDSGGQTAEASMDVYISASSISTTPPIKELSVLAELDNSSISVDETITVIAMASGGEEPYAYEFNWAISDGGWMMQRTGSIDEGHQSSLTPSHGRSGCVSVTVRDAQGNTADSDILDFLIEGDMTEAMALTGSISPKQVDMSNGDTVAASWEATGGVKPYFYYVTWWIDFQIAKDTYTTDATTASFQPIFGRGGFPFICVEDSEGRQTAWGVSDGFEITGTPPAPAPGDANGDSTIDILDLVSIIDYIVSNTSPASPTNADASGDGSVDILDLVWIIDRIVGG